MINRILTPLHAANIVHALAEDDGVRVDRVIHTYDINTDDILVRLDSAGTTYTVRIPSNVQSWSVHETQVWLKRKYPLVFKPRVIVDPSDCLETTG